MEQPISVYKMICLFICLFVRSFIYRLMVFFVITGNNKRKMLAQNFCSPQNSTFSSPGAKRNKRGETPLHVAAIKVSTFNTQCQSFLVLSTAAGFFGRSQIVGHYCRSLWYFYINKLNRVS